MRVLVASTGGAGHVTPMLPVAAACRRAGHDVVLVGPPDLHATAGAAGLPFLAGEVPDEAETAPVWAQVPHLTRDEAEHLVISRVFATLGTRAMLPAMRDAVRRWRPDVIVREPAEFASAVAAEEAGVPHVQVGVGTIEAHRQITALAAKAADAWRPGLTGRIAATPYLTFFPPSFDAGVEPSPTHRFRLPPHEASPLGDHWPGDDRPLVYVTFGSVAAAIPFAAPIVGVALDAVADLAARVLLTKGHAAERGRWRPSGPHVHVAPWVPQDDVLAVASVVVCHGGSGTTLGALAAGVPLVVTPLFADQPVNARRVAGCGAGVHVPHRPDAPSSAVDPADLRHGIESVLADPSFAGAARTVAAEIAGLPPVDEAVAVVGAAARA